MQNTTNTNNSDLGLWYKFDNASKKFPEISQAQFEWMYRKRNQNGLARAFKKIGKPKYVNVGILAELLLDDDN